MRRARVVHVGRWYPWRLLEEGGGYVCDPTGTPRRWSSERRAVRWADQSGYTVRRPWLTAEVDEAITT